jgi:hypothetical protein
VSVLANVILDSGFQVADIDKTSFSAVENHSIGIAIPREHDITSAETYREVIAEILKSMLWTMAFTDLSNEIKLGLFQVAPFVSAAGTAAKESDHNEFGFKHDYSDIYREVIVTYFKKDQEKPDNAQLGTSPYTGLVNGTIIETSDKAKNLHFSSSSIGIEVLQYDAAEAGEIARRFSIALGDRRGLYTISLGANFIGTANVGNYYILHREHLPGFEFVYGTENQRQVIVVEVQKSARGVTLTLEDQKGIQDDSGVW